MVLKEDRIPAAVGCGLLAGREGVLEIGELPLRRAAPDLRRSHGHVRVAELKEHVKDASLAHPLVELVGCDAVGLAHHKDVAAVTHGSLELVQEVEDTRGVGRGGVHRAHAVLAVDRAVRKDGGLLDVGDGIDAEAAHALVGPEVGDVDQCTAHVGVLPVEVGLLRSKGVQVVLLALLAPLPCAATKDGAPVSGSATVRSWIAPDVPVGIGALAALTRLHEPRALLGGVVKDQVHDHLDAAFVALGDKLVHVGHRAKRRIDLAVVLHVVAVVNHGALVARRDPDGTDAQGAQVIELGGNARKGARPLATGVQKALGVHLVGDGLLPPGQVVQGGHLRHLSLVAKGYSSFPA